MLTKREIRKNTLHILDKMSPSLYEQRSHQLMESLMQTEYWKQATVIALTVSRFPEVSTKKLIEHALSQQKKVALPRTDMTNKTMNFYYIESLQHLEKRSFGLFEPFEDENRLIEPIDFDLVVVPGVAFTVNGKRLGLGGGFYDRYLPKTSAITAALCFSEQVVNDLPIEKHDRVMDYVITEGTMK